MRGKSLAIVLSIILGGILFLPGSVKAIGVAPTVIDEIYLNPGETYPFDFRIMNDLGRDIGVYFESQNFTGTDGDETGKPRFLEKDEVSTGADLASWITMVEERVEITKGGDGRAHGIVKVPENAEPGGHYAVIWMGENNPKEQSLTIKGNVGLLVLINVNGDVREGATVKEFKYLKKFQNRLPVQFVARITNDGTIYIKPKGDIIIKGLFGNIAGRTIFNPNKSNILPNSTRQITNMVWEKTVGLAPEGQGFFKEIVNEWNNFGFGPYKAQLDVTIGKAGKLNIQTKYFWVIPWHLMIVAIIVLIILYVIFRGYNRSVINKAKKELAQDQQKKSDKKDDVE